MRIAILNKIPMRSWAGIFFLLASTTLLNAQLRCALIESDQRNVYERDGQFEKWLQQLKPAAKTQAREGQSENEYAIRIAVHVIHKGEQPGSGSNISDEQIQSQIEVLNKDFNRLNSDASLTPSEFLPVAGKMNITFELSAITRDRGSKSSWTIADNAELKENSYWPAEDYINIWVCDLTDYLGNTQFPVSTLPGIEGADNNRLTDGILISYRVFGSNDYGSFNLKPGYLKGRTLVHEMGHFFGLRHIWGDATDCLGTDYVADTPPQSDRTSGCPTHPQPDCPSQNPVNKMFQNYMDLSDDACMNLFTKNQIERMTIVLENSPRRASLLLPLDKPPVAGINKIFSPNGDGVNDYWRWDNPSLYSECTLFVFNRFGKKVFEMNSYDNSWDGRATEGYMLEPEAYYYVIKCPTQKEVTGGVRIIR
jgi:gliding motility-associated-like protein